MPQRDELFRKFGPLIVEGLVLITKDEINILRGLHGLAPRTNEQIMTALENKLAGLTLYDWMNMGP